MWDFGPAIRAAVGFAAFIAALLIGLAFLAGRYL